MEDRMFPILLGSLLATIFLAGCVGPTGPVGPQGPSGGVASGVVVKSFEAVPAEIYSGDDASFPFTIENVGESTATGVMIKFYGLGTDWENLPKEPESAGNLEGANPSENIAGESYSGEFTATSPSGLKTDNTYTACIRVSYGYETYAEGKIKVYKKDYLDSLPVERAKAIRRSSGIESFKVSNAPVKVSLMGLARPIIIEGDKTVTRKLSFKIENVGQGGNYWGDEKDRKVIITAHVGEHECFKDEEVKLSRRGTATVSCSFNIDGSEIENYETVPVKVTLEYKYFIDSCTSIKVLKSPE